MIIAAADPVSVHLLGDDGASEQEIMSSASVECVASDTVATRVYFIHGGGGGGGAL